MSQPLNGIRSILFDLDGTLVDSAPDLVGALDALLGEHGRAPVGEAAGRTMIGEGAARLVERGFAARGGLPGPVGGLVPRFVEIYEARLTRVTRPFEGAVAVLSALRDAGFALGICTNKPDRATHRILGELGLSGFFSAVVGGDGVRKPDPDPVLRCLAALGGDAREAVFVGDSPVDLAAARAAGLPVILVSFGYTAVPARELGADHVVDSLPEIAALVGR
ncbi:MAG: phosphoglycolate phosphatase [Alphaproteobacteria bacterium]